MIDMSAIQKKIYQNKVNKGFNTTNVYKEFLYIHDELSEAFQAFNMEKADLGEELADVAIYLLGLSEILGINLENEILLKMEKNEKRIYINGVKVESNE